MEVLREFCFSSVLRFIVCMRAYTQTWLPKDATTDSSGRDFKMWFLIKSSVEPSGASYEFCGN